MAYANLASNCLAALRSEEAPPAAALKPGPSRRHGHSVYALATPGVATPPAAREPEQSLDARRDGPPSRSGIRAARRDSSHRAPPRGGEQVPGGRNGTAASEVSISSCSICSPLGPVAADQGRWAEAADSAAAVLRVQRTSITPRIVSLVVLGLVRARRGDPGQWEPLDEAWRLAEPTGELTRLGPVAAARAEAAWLEGEPGAVDAATEAALSLAVERSSRMLAGELAVWRRRAGLDEEAPERAAEPYALELAGDWARAADAWAAIGCPYEAALALGAAEDEKAAALARRTATAGRSPGCGDRGSAAARARRARSPTRAPRRDAREPGRSDGAPTGGTGAARGGAHEFADRRSPRRFAADCRPPRCDDPAKARRPHARRGERPSRAARPRGPR